MSWITDTLGSSIGKKLLMSLTGLFLILFLVIHLIGNLAIFSDDGGLSFNSYAVFMSSFPLIKAVSYLLYFSILLHAFFAMMLWFLNRKARPVRYAVEHANQNSTWASRSMTLLGSLIFIFLIMHLKDFWWQYKFGGGYEFEIDANGNRDIYKLVILQFQYTYVLVAYLIGLVALAFHLWHGFESAFQTLGLNHERYTPVIKFIGILYALLVPLGFAMMPVYVYFFMK
jgi:succinate dehydrogenase / fumarate reductase cytochrome b subunit